MTVDARRARCRADSVAELLTPAPAFVVDAIDSLEDKVALIRYCLQAGIPLVSCMGGAGRTDPTRVRCGDISTVSSCPLAKTVRRVLKEGGITHGVPVVYSLQQPVAPLRYGQPLPSCCAVPAAVGLAAAACALRGLAEQVA